jgi:hypothetical protein
VRERQRERDSGKKIERLSDCESESKIVFMCICGMCVFACDTL